MTARAGDALSHVYFRPLPSSIFQRISLTIFATASQAAKRHVGDNVIGSARICMGAMSRRKQARNLFATGLLAGTL